MFDLAIGGEGFLPAILALQLRSHMPALRMLLLSGDAQIPGDCLELVFPKRLPPSLAQTLAPCIVGQWPGLLLAERSGAVSTLGEPVAMLDSAQLHIELLDCFDAPSLVAGCGDIVREDGALVFAGRRVRVADFIDLRSPGGAAARTDIVEGAALAGLALPALFDFSLPGEDWSCLMQVPIGGGRIAVRRLSQGTAGWIPEEISGLPGGDNYQLLHAAGLDFA